MANYNVDIAVALKGAKELLKLKKDVKAVTQEVNGFNKALQTNANKFPKTINSLAEQVNKARTALKNAAVGTSTFTRAGEVLIKTQKALNKELAEEARILKQIETRRFGVAQSSSGNRVRRNVAESAKNRIDPKFKSLSLLGQTSPVGGKLERTIALKRDEVRLQEALLALEIKSAAKQNEKLQLIGEVNRQTAQAVNNARLRGQSSPFTSDIRGNIGDVKSRIEGNTLASRRAKFRNVFSGVSGRDFGQIGGRIGPVEPIRSEGGFRAFSKKANEIAKGVKANVKQTTKTAQLLSQQATRATFEDIGFGVKGGQIGPATPLTRAEKMGFGRRASSRGPFAMQGGAMGRLKGGVGSAMIGGGFPALFGAGGLSSLMGGVAGGIGGALAPGGGFAASIFATAIAAEIEKIRNFRKAVRTLNEDLKNAGAVTQFTRKEIRELGRDLDITKEEAAELVASFSKFADVGGLDLARLFGSRDLFDATVGLNDFSSVLARIQQLSEELTLGTEFEAYKILSTEGAEAANDFIINSLLASKQADVFTERFEESLKRVKRFSEGGTGITSQLKDITAFANKDFNKVLEAIMNENKQIQAILQDESKPFADRLKEVDKVLVPILTNTELLKDALSKLPPEFDLSVEGAKKLVDQLSKNVENLQFLQEFKAPNEEFKKLMNPMRTVLDLSKEIKIGFEDSFKGIIKGTMSVSDAFRSMLNRIGDYFLDLAAQLIGLQIQKGFLGLFSNMFTGPINDVQNTVMMAANGGPVGMRQPYLVGERGPELFVPNQSGNIIPNHDLAGVGGGGTNIVVNVDASGSSVEGDEDEGRALGVALSAAIETELIKQKRPGGLLA